MASAAALSPRETLAKRENSVGDRLPWSHQADDFTIATRDGMQCQFIHLAGLPFETVDTDDLNFRHTIRETMLRAVADPHLGIYHHILRRPVDAVLPGTATDPFCAEIDTAWRARLTAKQMFVNELFLTVVRRPLQGRTGILDGVAELFRPKSSSGEDMAGRRDLHTAVDAMLRSLSPYGARRLGVYETPQGICSEAAEFLSFLLDGELRPVLLPRADLGRYLPRKRYSFGVDTIDIKGATDAERRFAAMISIKDYPPATAPGLLDNLLRLPHEMVVSQSFGFVDRTAALGRMNLALRRMRATDDDAVSLRSGLSEAKDNVAAGRAGFGEHHLSVQVRVPTLGQLDTAVADVLSSFTDLGLIAVREDVALEPVFWAQFPGNFKDVARRSLISTGNFASFASLHNFPVGRASGNHWGDAITVLETTSGTPYHFNFHVGDLGNFTVIGPSGSGKTVVLTFLLAQASKLGPRTVYFDKDRGAEIFIRATGGRYSVLRPGHPSGLNPLALPDTPTNRRFLTEWAERLLLPASGVLDTTDREVIAAAVDANFDQAPQFRRLRYFRELLSGTRRPTAGDLAHRLAPWIEGGDRAWLFDNEVDRFDLEGHGIGVDMTQLLDDPATRTPAMMYLFHRVEERLDGTPTIIVVDEGWKALDDEAFVARIKDWEKTIRKRGGIVGFATQNARDALDSRIGPAIIEQAATQIFMPNPKAQEADYRQGFGLSEHELDLVRSLPDTSHCFLVKHGNDSVIARLDLTGLDRILTVLSGREATVRILDGLRAELGDDPKDWLEPLLTAVAETRR
ncbi:VirB4 family type IV secretion/conjugal transfer ATPase [Glacieibacterium sp.]|uniref:VirB4 family type IV secretion/conjugal transfer ATPase n=1 Tax=Glacieibacterium sp. TaxID=2860237 RepID=UPI003AFFCD94